MISTLRALLGEQLWRNRRVLPVLSILFLVGAGLTYALKHAASNVWWFDHAQAIVILIFLVSLLLGFAPFTLMESHGSWRMNSMVTRWFSLPVRTSVLVLAPLVAACGSMTLLICSWTPLLKLQFEGFDAIYFLAVLVAGVAAIQSLAWIVPRKPGQFWPLAGFLFLTALVVAVLPQNSQRWEAHRPEMSWAILSMLPMFAAVGYYAARRNRCGDWPGGLSFGSIRRWVAIQPPPSTPSTRDFESPAAALFWSETLGPVRRLFLTWLALGLVVTAAVCGAWQVSERYLIMTPTVCTLIGIKLLPVLSVLWLALAGLLLGGEPGAGCRTRLSPFRATLPVSAGTLATQRLIAVLLLWVLVWLPLWLTLALGKYDSTLTRMPAEEVIRSAAISMAGWMAISAHAIVGALPLYLRGRFDGFPNLLLGAMACWVGPFLLCMAMRGDEELSGRWIVALPWLVAKIGVAAWALYRSWQVGIISWRFAFVLIGTWLVFACLLIWALPTWQTSGVWSALPVLLFLPLARPALCPLAVDANRHR